MPQSSRGRSPQIHHRHRGTFRPQSSRGRSPQIHHRHRGTLRPQSSRGRSPQIHHRHRGTFMLQSKPRKHRLREGGGEGAEVEQFSIRDDLIEGQRSSLRVQEHRHST
uniref:Uncharacterized protein n=1 Tax=Knipowitschia caucasica TaxID=637954 RepID=A0AAV2LKP4_KNICA